MGAAAYCLVYQVNRADSRFRALMAAQLEASALEQRAVDPAVLTAPEAFIEPPAP